MTQRRPAVSLSSWRWRWLAIAGAVVFGATVATSIPDAVAQPAPTSSAKSQPSKKDGGAPPPGKDAGAASKDAGLPEGHPPVGGDLPEGHPPTQNPRQQPRQDDPHGGGFFQPPEDVLQSDPSLPPGSIVFSLRDAEDRPVSAPIRLTVHHSTVAKGESTNEIARDTSSDGEARFDGLEVGAAVSYTISATRGPGRYETTKFTLDDKAGKRVSLHVFDATRNHDDMRLGMWGVVFVQLREDVIVVEHHMTILNVERVAWVPEGFVMTLPEGFKAFTVPDGMEVRFKEAAGQGAALEGTITPGQHDTMFRYHVPLSGSERQTISVKMPPKVFQIGIMAEASKKMGMEAAGFPAAQKSERNGKRVLITKKQAGGPGDEIATVDVTLTGLPVQGPARWIAVAIAACSVGFGFFFVKRRQDEGGADPETLKDLNDAREALLDEILALERAHKAGDVGPRSYERIRTSLLDALARVVDQIEQQKSGVEPRRRATA